MNLNTRVLVGIFGGLMREAKVTAAEEGNSTRLLVEDLSGINPKHRGLQYSCQLPKSKASCQHRHVTAPLTALAAIGKTANDEFVSTHGHSEIRSVCSFDC